MSMSLHNIGTFIDLFYPDSTKDEKLSRKKCSLGLGSVGSLAANAMATFGGTFLQQGKMITFMLLLISQQLSSWTK